MDNDIISLQTNVLFNAQEIHSLHMHHAPRSLFDLIPGEAHEMTILNQAMWIKSMLLADAPGSPIKMMIYCSEPPLCETEPKIETEMGN